MKNLIQNILKKRFITKIAFTIIGCLFISHSFAQGWVGDESTNSLYGINSDLAVTPLRVGIGTTNPSAQFHTTSSVRFQGLPTSFQNQFLVSDASGNVSLRDGSTILASNAWLLNGNSAVGTNFIGTLNSEDFRVRTNNLQRMVVTSAGRVGIGLTATAPTKTVDIRYSQNLAYNPTAWNRDGLLIYNDFASTGVGQASTLTFAARGGANSWQGRAIISGVITGSDQMDLTFQNEYTGSASVSESMRITSEGYVRINEPADDVPRFLNVDAENRPIRFENLPSGQGSQLVIDANGDVFVRNKNISVEGGLRNEVDELRKELNELKELLGVQLENEPKSWLKQSYPNPGTNVLIKYYVHDFDNEAYLMVYDMNGKTVVEEIINRSGNGEFRISAVNNPTGIYQYALVIDGEVVDAKKMILSE